MSRSFLKKNINHFGKVFKDVSQFFDNTDKSERHIAKALDTVSSDQNARLTA